MNKTAKRCPVFIRLKEGCACNYQSDSCFKCYIPSLLSDGCVTLIPACVYTFVCVHVYMCLCVCLCVCGEDRGSLLFGSSPGLTPVMAVLCLLAHSLV